MDIDKAIKQLRKLARRGASEEGHIDADGILAAVIEAHVPRGDEITEAYHGVGKWYA